MTIDEPNGKGEIDVEDEIVFHTHHEVMNLFGHNYELYLRSIGSHAIEANVAVWFPKFIEDGTWDNTLIDNGRRIEERRIDGKNNAALQNNMERAHYYRRITFGAYEENRIRVYRFIGVFELDRTASQQAGISIFNRIATTVKLYPAE